MIVCGWDLFGGVPNYWYFSLMTYDFSASSYIKKSYKVIIIMNKSYDYHTTSVLYCIVDRPEYIIKCLQVLNITKR